MNKYLLEIGTEELPYKFIPSGLKQLEEALSKMLEENEISFAGMKMYATPRRLAVVIDGLPDKQDDVEKVVKGPISNIAYDEQGELTKAALGFAKKNGVEPSQLFKKDNYVWAKIEQKGKTVDEILKSVMPDVIFKLRGSHFMSWADLEVKFQRPIRWIVSLLNDKIVEFEVAQVKASNVSRGHRFSAESIVIEHPDKYEETLASVNVIADSEKRKARIVELAKETADKIGAQVVMDSDLVDEVTYLTEWPVPIVCDFAEKYLDIPDKVTVTVMATHQRYFPLYKDGKLLNKFITMANYVGDAFENIKAGNERVVTARLEDAIFFFKEDTQKSLGDNLEALKGVTFQKGLGSVYDKTLRIVELSKHISKELNIPSEKIERTALLCKADLVTSLVFEFTELQGFIGADYALLSGESAGVAEGIKEHYFPLNAESEVAKGIEGQVVGIADKIDTIVAVFAEGKKITGSQDPLGVRRATLGILKTIIANNLKINLSELIQKSIDLIPLSLDSEAKSKLYKDVKEFFEQRLIVFYSDSYKYDVIEACVSGKDVLLNLDDFIERLSVVSSMVSSPSYGSFHEAANRVIRIIKKEETSQEPSVDLFNNPVEGALWDCIKSINLDKLNYEQLAFALTKSVEPINNFFDKVLVMDEDEKVKQNRINLLSVAKKKFESLADFSKVVH